jgi:hypothetical protein
MITKVAHDYKEGDYNLGGWVSRQRTNKDTLSPERRQRLEEIGFVWDTRVAPSTDNCTPPIPKYLGRVPLDQIQFLPRYRR